MATIQLTIGTTIEILTIPSGKFARTAQAYLKYYEYDINNMTTQEQAKAFLRLIRQHVIEKGLDREILESEKAARESVINSPPEFGDDPLPPPIAKFISTPGGGTAPLIVAFTDQSTNATEWHWDFGDGNTSTEQNPTHTYQEAGTYTPLLIVRNLSGEDRTTRQVIVQ